MPRFESFKDALYDDLVGVLGEHGIKPSLVGLQWSRLIECSVTSLVEDVAEHLQRISPERFSRDEGA